MCDGCIYVQMDGTTDIGDCVNSCIDIHMYILFFTTFKTFYQNNAYPIAHLLALLNSYRAELSESGAELADRAGKKRLFAAMQPCTITYTIQFVYRA